MNAAFSVVNALAFVEAHGLVLASAKGPAARLIDAIAGEPIAGNWWSHPRSRAIYKIFLEVTGSDQVLVCRLLDGKITLVHRRLWPALVRLADRFAPERLAQVQEEHTASGRHASREVPFPQWVPREIAEQADAMEEREAVALLELWLPSLEGKRIRGR